jgi:hypothetical protein
MHLRTLFDSRDAEALLHRLDHLQPSDARRWGRMNAHQAVCHLSDSLKAVLGDRPLAPQPLTLKRRIVRFIGFTLPFPWPKAKVRTSAELDPLKQGTPPGIFEADVGELRELLGRVRRSRGLGVPRHYAWGELKPAVLGRYVFRHVDHHLRQFGR